MKTKATKKLVTSLVAIMICFSMLIGTTFAWFTDSTSSGSNVIVSGNLDINVEYTLDGENWSDLEGATDMFQKGLWEPGHTEVVALKIANKGSLVLKYKAYMKIFGEKVGVNKDGEQIILSEILNISTLVQQANVIGDITVMQAFKGENNVAYESTSKLSEGLNLRSDVELFSGDAHYLIVKIDMPETVGNEANHNGVDIPEIEVGMDVVATQYTFENDSFGNDYDAGATIIDAIFQQGGVIELEGNIASSKTVSEGASVVMNMNNNTMSGTLINNGEVALSEGVIEVEGSGFDNYGTATITEVTMNAGSTAAYANKTVGAQAQTTYEEVAINSAGGGVGVADGASVTFNSGSVEVDSKSTSGRYLFYLEGEGSELTINGGNFDFNKTQNQKRAYIYAGVGTTVYVKGGTFGKASTRSGYTAGILGEGKVIVTGGTFGFDPSKWVPLGYEVENNDGIWTVSEMTSSEKNQALKDAIQDNATVEVPSGQFTLPTLGGKTGVTIEGAVDGSTIIGGESASTGFGGNFGKDTTIKNLTFTGSTNGVRYSYANGGTSTFENCTFAGKSTYGFHIDQSNGATLIFNNCSFSGFNAFASDLEKVVFNNCTFLHNGNYGHTNIWSTAEFNNCVFGDKASVSTAGTNAHIYFNGVEESYHHEYIGSAESLFAFANSVNEGQDSWTNQKVCLVADIDLENKAWTPIGQTGATEFRGIFDGQNYTIKNLYVDNTDKTDAHTSSGLFGWAERNVTIMNVKVDGATIKGNHNVAVIVGYTYSGKITNCHVSNAQIVCTHANGDACGDKCGLIAGYAADESRITDCSGSNSTVSAGRDAGQLIGCGYNVSVSNCSVTDVTVTANGSCNKEANINNAIIGRVMA